MYTMGGFDRVRPLAATMATVVSEFASKRESAAGRTVGKRELHRDSKALLVSFFQDAFQGYYVRLRREGRDAEGVDPTSVQL